MTPFQPARDDPVQVALAPNGAEVHLLATDRPRTSLCLWTVEGVSEGPRAPTALLADLLTRGTARSPGLADMAARCEELYDADLQSSVTAHGPTQVLRFGVEVLADRYVPDRPLFEQGVALLAEALREPPLEGGRLRADHLAQERDNLVHAIEGLADDKGLLAWRRMVEAMHAGTPYARHSWGDLADARALDEPTVHAAWDRLRDRAPARLMVIGEVTMEQALEAARVVGGEGPRDPVTVHGPPRRMPRPTVQQLRDAEPVAQSQLVMGFAVDPAAWEGPDASLAAQALGGGSHSRLFKRVREAEGLAYGCSASLLPDSATLVVQAGIDRDQAERVQAAVVEELARLAGGELDEAELDLSRRAVLRRLDAMPDRPRELAAYRMFGLSTGREHRPERSAELVRAAGVDGVCRAAGAFRLDTVYLLEGTSP